MFFGYDLPFTLHDLVVIQVGNPGVPTEVYFTGAYIARRAKELFLVFENSAGTVYVKPASAFPQINQRKIIKLANPETTQM